MAHLLFHNRKTNPKKFMYSDGETFITAMQLSLHSIPVL